MGTAKLKSIMIKPWPGAALPCDIKLSTATIRSQSSRTAALVGSLWDPSQLTYVHDVVLRLQKDGITLHHYGYCNWCNSRCRLPGAQGANLCRILNGSTTGFRTHASVSDGAALNLLDTSLMSPDFRKDSHIRSEYAPDRWFRHAAGGALIVTNSPAAAHYFGDAAVATQNGTRMVDDALRILKNRTELKRVLSKAAGIVRSEHTYTHRVLSLISMFPNAR